MAATPYLYFTGEAAEAFTRYAEIFGGEPQIMRFGDMGPEAPPGSEGYVMHAFLMSPHVTIMASDEFQETEPLGDANRVAISVDVPTVEEAHRIFAQLAEGGTVIQEQLETFFALTWGIVQDRFGIRWMVSAFKDPNQH